MAPQQLQAGASFRGGLASVAVLTLVSMCGAIRKMVDTSVVFVGSAQCDWDDYTCENREPQPEEKFVHAVRVGLRGELSARPEGRVDVGGVPAWLTAGSTSAGTTCLFVSRVDTDDILALPIGPGAQPQLPGSSAPAGGKSPIHSALTEGGNYLVGTSYGGEEAGASLEAYQVGAGCELQLTQAVVHNGGSGVIPWRQGAAHVHGAFPGRDGLVFACDLGMDMVFVYRLGSGGEVEELSRTETPRGCGPRHAALHPNGHIIYVLCELSQAVLTYQRTGEEEGSLESAALDLQQTSSLLKDGASGGGSKAGEILIAPDGSALFATNRGGAQNTLTSFSIGDSKGQGEGEGEGLLAWAQQVEAPAFPRGMLLVHGGRVLLVAGQSSTELVSYHVRPGAQLEATGHSLKSGLPPHPAALAAVP